MSCINSFEDCECTTSSSDLTEEELPRLLSPFDLQWTFGFDTFAPLINLSTEDRSLIAYACSHMTVLYEYKSRKMFKLQGHRNCVRTLSTDRTGRWLLTADFEHDSTVVIWDIEKRIPIFTLFNPHEENEMTAAALSPDAKYIVTVGNEDVQSVKIWHWTFGNDLPDAEITLTDTCRERVKDIAFDWQDPNSLALTTDSRVVFVRMDHEKDLIAHCPAILKKPTGLGIFNNTVLFPGTTKAFTGTENGFVLTWIRDPENKSQEDVKMIHAKSNPLQKFNITKIINYLGMLVAGNSRGEIVFYDGDLQILYACREIGLDFVTSISFDIQFEGPSFERESRKPGENDDDDKSNEIVCGKAEERVDVPSNVTVKIEHPPKPRANIVKRCDDKDCVAYARKFDKYKVPRDATLRSNEFTADKFIVATKKGRMFRIDIPSMKCRKISHYFNTAVTAIDVHPQDKYFIIGDDVGSLFLFNYANRQMKLKRDLPELPDLLPILKRELLARRILHVTYAAVDESKKSYPSVIKYSPNATVVICALENGAFWVLHPDTFEILDELPYRHSQTPILDVVFSHCSEYMAYYDAASTVVVFKRHRRTPIEKIANYYYDFVGKYRSHTALCRCVLFGAPTSDDKRAPPRLLSLGEDRVLIEYNLLKSGASYPRPGLVIKEISKVENEQVPFFMAWYPRFGVENCLVISNSDYKLRLINSESKKVRATMLGPTFDTPIKKMIIQKIDEEKNIAHMVFASDRQIGLQLLPMDGNPHKILTAIGHPHKITWMRISHCGNFLFTVGKDDRSVLMWKIIYRSVEIAHRLGGSGLSPFYGLVDGGKEGWLFQEMQDLFVYAQILEQGKNSMKARRIDDEVSVEQLPNLMRSVGFYPSSYQMDNLMDEVVYRDYATSGKMNMRLTFEEFVKLYVNHRPTFGISMDQLKKAFAVLGEREGFDDLTISKQQFFDILCSNKSGERGDAMDPKEICKYLEYLMLGDQSDHFSKMSKRKSKNVLDLLPKRISHKDFLDKVLGITMKISSGDE